MSADGDKLVDPWTDAGSGVKALSLDDSNEDGVTDIQDLMAILTNYGRNQFKFMFPSMRGALDSDSTKRSVPGGACPECLICPSTCICDVNNDPGIPYIWCCCDGIFWCGVNNCPDEDPNCCNGGPPPPPPECNLGSCSISLECTYVQVGGDTVDLTLGYSAPPPGTVPFDARRA